MNETCFEPVLNASPISSLIRQLIYACQSLNMEPKPILNPKGDYLIDKDYWADHAYEHILKAIDHLRKLEK